MSLTIDDLVEHNKNLIKMLRRQERDLQIAALVIESTLASGVRLADVNPLLDLDDIVIQADSVAALREAVRSIRYGK